MIKSTSVASLFFKFKRKLKEVMQANESLFTVKLADVCFVYFYIEMYINTHIYILYVCMYIYIH